MIDSTKSRSRRNFLYRALASAAFLSSKTASARELEPERERLLRALARYGSEIGDLRRVGGRE